jgi:hypothetical protein
MDTSSHEIPFYPKDEVSKFKLPKLKEVCDSLGIDHENASGNSGAAKLRKILISYYSEKFPEKFLVTTKKPRVPLIPKTPLEKENSTSMIPKPPEVKTEVKLVPKPPEVKLKPKPPKDETEVKLVPKPPEVKLKPKPPKVETEVKLKPKPPKDKTEVKLVPKSPEDETEVKLKSPDEETHVKSESKSEPKSEVTQKFFIKEDDANTEPFEFNGQCYMVYYDKQLVYEKDVEGDWIVAGKWNPETEMPELN